VPVTCASGARLTSATTRLSKAILSGQFVRTIRVRSEIGEVTTGVPFSDWTAGDGEGTLDVPAN